ncbi:MAG: uracil-DNA glycosylase [Gammaproteobacteria bacterium]
MSKSTAFPLDENTRRYYLDVLGIQCWQLRDAEDGPVADRPAEEKQAAERGSLAADNKDVISTDVITEGNNWPQLETTIQQCDKCQLSVSRKQAIAGRGNQSAEWMFILLAPGSSDDEAGTICSGDANDLFSKMLAAINVPIDDIYITSLLKCKVPVRHTVSPQEIKHCFAYLKQQIQLIQPKLLIVLGGTAIRCLLQKNLSLDDFRAMNTSEPSYIESVPVFVSYSPQELLQQAENKRKAWADLQQLQKLIEN